MEGRRVGILVVFVLVIAIFGVPLANAHIPPGTCIKHCLKECKNSGIGAAACIKYCPVHCLPPAASDKEHYCSLGCMLEICSKLTDDEKKMTDCVYNCHKYHCSIKI